MMPDPEMFHGDRRNLPDFLTQVRLKLLANADQFLTENSITMYIISWLDVAALRQIATFIDGTTIIFATPQELLEYLDTSFGDPDPNGTARGELHEGKQSMDFSAYHTEFKRIMGKLKYDEAAQMDALENGLSNKLNDALVFTTRPNTMAEYERELPALNNRIKAREEEKKGNRNTMRQYTAPPIISSFTPGGLAPIDLSATQWKNPRSPARPHPNQRHEIVNGIKKTTMAEKAWRWANNFCDLSGGEGHAYQNCPAKSQHPPHRYSMHSAPLTTSSTPPLPPPITSTSTPPAAGFQ
jgi:hypothetical protein